ncbi:MAG: SRPBCC domain-containing protein [Thermoanaerobaculia bacterium]
MSRAPQKPRTLRRLLATALVLAAGFVAGSIWLFSGSVVTCEERMAADDGPSLLCAFEVGALAEAVWDAFTRVGEPRRQYFAAILEAEMRPGGRWRFVTDDRERFLAGGEVLAIDRPRRFAHSFQAADLADPPSRVTVEIEETSGGSRVTLVHDRFPGKTATYRRFRRAHPLALSALKSLLETGELPLRARIYTALFKPGMKMFGVRAEPWE